jgi:hypothetical protein
MEGINILSSFLTFVLRGATADPSTAPLAVRLREASLRMTVWLGGEEFLTADSSASLRNDNKKNKQQQKLRQRQPQIPFGDDNKKS